MFLECSLISISVSRFVFADRLFLPSALVLSDCGITTSGDGRTIAAFCGHVVELDLSKNQLNDWVEVRWDSKIVLFSFKFSKKFVGGESCMHEQF